MREGFRELIPNAFSRRKQLPNSNQAVDKAAVFPLFPDSSHCFLELTLCWVFPLLWAWMVRINIQSQSPGGRWVCSFRLFNDSPHNFPTLSLLLSLLECLFAKFLDSVYWIVVRTECSQSMTSLRILERRKGWIEFVIQSSAGAEREKRTGTSRHKNCPPFKTCILCFPANQNEIRTFYAWVMEGRTRDREKTVWSDERMYVCMCMCGSCTA